MIYEEAVLCHEALHGGAKTLPDEKALKVPFLFDAWAIGLHCVKDERYTYEDKLYRCEQTHDAQEGWEPPKVPALFTNVAEPGTIPVWVQPTGAQDAYNTGDKVWYPDVDTTVYESLIDNNVWSPEAYPQGWKLVEGNVVVPDTPDIVVEDVESVIQLEDIGSETPAEPEVKKSTRKRTVKETNNETT